MSGILRKTTQRDIARNSTEIRIRPTPEGTYYRFRLLNFIPDDEFVNSAGLTYYRDDPFLPRYIHEVWIDEPSDKSPTGLRKVRHVIPCPRSEYVRVNGNLNAKACPICSAGNQALKAYSDSGKQNQVAKKKYLACRNKFEALIPVYVVTDPNNDAINGNVKVWRASEDQYKQLVALINEATSKGISVWNDTAVDLYFSYGTVQKSRTNQRTKQVTQWEQNDIIKMGFTTTPRTIEGLDALVKALNFDATWFTIPSSDELQGFYAKYIATASAPANDIPNDIPEDPPFQATPAPAPAPAPEPKPAPTPKAAKPKPVEKPAPAPAPSTEIGDSDIDSFMQGITI